MEKRREMGENGGRNGVGRDWEEGSNPEQEEACLGRQPPCRPSWESYVAKRGRHGPRATSSPPVAAGTRIVGGRKKEKKERTKKNEMKKESLCKQEIEKFEEVQVEEDMLSTTASVWTTGWIHSHRQCNPPSPCPRWSPSSASEVHSARASACRTRLPRHRQS